MADKQFRTEFLDNWKKFRNVVIETAPHIVEAFKGTSLEDNFYQWYELAVPQNGESPINFLLRNTRYSYGTTSPHQAAELAANNSIAKIGWFLGKVPALRRIIRLTEASTELYLGQETMGYVSDRQENKRKGFGNDLIKFVSSNYAKPMDLDIEVGFTNPNNPKNGRNWFYQINVHDESLIQPAEQAYDIIQRVALNGGKAK